MSIDLAGLDNSHRLLFAIPLEPVQGKRFQPTGFPSLGAATFQTQDGQSLLVESAQSMANRLELMVWDEANQELRADLAGLSHVKVLRHGRFLTDTVLEAHRVNSPYVMFATHKGRDVFDQLGETLGAFDVGPLPGRSEIARIFLQWDIGSLLHGAFLSAKKGKETLAGGRVRIPRTLSAFIEADGVRVAASGGVKNDHVNPSGETKSGFGNVPFARDEFTAEKITLYVNLDLAQIRGYGLGSDVERLLILLALYKLRALVDGGMRLRTACDLKVTGDDIHATQPDGFKLPSLLELTSALKPAIAACKDKMAVTEVTFNDELKKGKEEESAAADEDEEATEA